ncbi:uncharacterized protein LOC132563931 [Ylistrum balloti]|uniref:uncharacterized protein LOC132563931 n=1 Tax=Ylistrum balloti TaxID=509963 RepID=UPI002905F1F0|nr:uncharacterized protein LOC132563931 [Ylistrum balloti]
MKTAVSFLPAATQTILDLNAKHCLRGVTFECPESARRDLPIIVHCHLDVEHTTSQDIDRLFSSYAQTGKPLYWVDDQKLQLAAPEVVFTQDVCDICQIDTKCTQASLDKLSIMPEIIRLTPQSLDDVFMDASRIASAIGQHERGQQFITNLRTRLQIIVETLRKHQAPLRRVSLLEWLDPIYNCGHWIPEQLAYAGGIDMLSHPRGDSIRIDWETIRRYDPEIICLAPCGFDVTRSLQELEPFMQLPGLQDLQAWQQDTIFVLDYTYFTQPSIRTNVEGIELLAHLFHPELFPEPVPEGDTWIRLKHH